MLSSNPMAKGASFRPANKSPYSTSRYSSRSATRDAFSSVETLDGHAARFVLGYRVVVMKGRQFAEPTRRCRMGIEVGGLLGLIWLIIVIWAIVKVAKSSAGGLAKVVWALVLLFFPLVGLIVWFLFGPKG